MATGKYEAAIEDFNAALNVNANNSEAWAGLGFCYEKLNNHAKAVEATNAPSRSIPTTATARGPAAPGLRRAEACGRRRNSTRSSDPWHSAAEL